MLVATSSCFGNHVPKPGDFTICAACFRLLRFTPSMGLDVVSAHEFSKMHDKQRQEIVVARELLMKCVSGVR